MASKPYRWKYFMSVLFLAKFKIPNNQKSMDSFKYTDESLILFIKIVIDMQIQLLHIVK